MNDVDDHGSDGLSTNEELVNGVGAGHGGGEEIGDLASVGSEDFDTMMAGPIVGGAGASRGKKRKSEGGTWEDGEGEGGELGLGEDGASRKKGKESQR